MALFQTTFFSNVLGITTSMNVILPQKIEAWESKIADDGDGKIPTLYLLHGMSDDHAAWERNSSIERYATDLGIAVVMPTVHLGWYTNTTYGLDYWTFISEELPKICHTFFPMLTNKREHTFVAGLSMGGYGAIKLGLGASETFGYAASLSGALNMADVGKREVEEKRNNFFSGVFGPLDKIKGSENDLLYLAEKLVKSGKPLPKMYIWCGTEDFLYEDNQIALKCFRELGYDVTYEESPGDHQWKYWDEKIKTVLNWLPIK